jgi:F-type H+-transporting ATPase subunit epsilon
MGILPGHTRLVSELGVGELNVTGGGQDQKYFVAGGYVDVAEDNVTVLVDVVEKPADIDAERAEKAKQRALDRLNNIGSKSDVDLMRAQAALSRAEGRLAIVGRSR